MRSFHMSLIYLSLLSNNNSAIIALFLQLNTYYEVSFFDACLCSLLKWVMWQPLDLLLAPNLPI